VKSPTPEELAESRVAASLPPETSGRRAAATGLLLLAGIVVLAFVRPRLAGTIGVLVAIIAMIMLHELGHFVMAKRAGMKVTEFFLGFGPRLWSIRRGETEYGVKAIPAGGYVRIVGRAKDMVIVGGFNVYPAEIEHVLAEHAGVAEAAAVGIPDERLGEVVVAFVVASTTPPPEPETLLRWCHDRLANFKVPRRVWIVDSFPRAALGKIAKQALRERASSWLAG